MYTVISKRVERSSRVLPEALAPRLESRAFWPDGDDPGPRLLRVGAALDGHSQRGEAHLQDAHPVHARRRRRRRRRRVQVQLVGGVGAAAVRRPGRWHRLEESVKLKSYPNCTEPGNGVCIFANRKTGTVEVFIVRNATPPQILYPKFPLHDVGPSWHILWATIPWIMLFYNPDSRGK